LHPIEAVRLHVETGWSKTNGFENQLALDLGNFNRLKNLDRPSLEDRIQYRRSTFLHVAITT
jgi:hypothetical protein